MYPGKQISRGQLEIKRARYEYTYNNRCSKMTQPQMTSISLKKDQYAKEEKKNQKRKGKKEAKSWSWP